MDFRRRVRWVVRRVWSFREVYLGGRGVEVEVEVVGVGEEEEEGSEVVCWRWDSRSGLGALFSRSFALYLLSFPSAHFKIVLTAPVPTSPKTSSPFSLR